MKLQEGYIAAIRKDADGDFHVSYIPDNIKVGDELPEDYLRVFETREQAVYEMNLTRRMHDETPIGPEHCKE